MGGEARTRLEHDHLEDRDLTGSEKPVNREIDLRKMIPKANCKLFDSLSAASYLSRHR